MHICGTDSKVELSEDKGMRIYRDVIFPKLMKLNIGKKSILEKRRNCLSNADGEILEIDHKYLIIRL